MRILLCMAFTLSGWMQVYGQETPCTLSFSGRVVDEDHEDPLSFATVFIDSINVAAMCDENGKFSFDGLCPGKYNVIISHVGCATISVPVTLTASAFAEYRLDHTIEDLDNLEVHGKVEHQRGTMTQQTIEGVELDRLTGKSLGAALRSANGVQVLQTGSSIAKPVIHGLHSNRILIMNNGVRQEGQQWGNEHGPEIDPFIADRYTIIKGAAAVKYGSDAMGGVILVDPAPLPDSAGTSGTVHLVGFSNTRGGAFAGMLQQQNNAYPSMRYRLQGSVQREGNTHAPDYYLANTAHGSTNMSAAMGYFKGDWRSEVYYSLYHAKVGIFAGSHIGNLTDLQTAFASDTPLVHQDFTYTIGRPYQLITHHLLKSVTDHHSEKYGNMMITVAWQNDLRREYDADVPLNDSIAALELPSLYFEIGTLTIDGEWELHPGKNFTSTFGINGMNQQNITRYSVFIPNFKNYSGGVYGIERYRNGRWLLEAGARYDYKWMKIFRYQNGELDMPERTFSNLSGNLGAQYFDGNHTQYNVNISTAWRAPSVSELYSDGLHHGAASLEYGDDSLNAERSYQAIFSLEHQSASWFIDFGVYNNLINDFIFLEPTLPPELTIRGAFPVFYYRQTNANLLGSDLLIRYKIIAALEAEVKSSILRARDLTNKNWIVMMPADRLSAGLTYTIPKTGKLTDLKINVHAEHVWEQTRVIALADYVPPPGGYTLAGGFIEGAIYFNQTKVIWGIEGSNVLNAAYRDYLNRFRYFADDMGRNITVRLKIPLAFSASQE